MRAGRRADGCGSRPEPCGGGAFAREVHAAHADVEGLLYASRLTGKDVYAVFDRGAGKLECGESGRLEEHPELPEVLERHGIGLIV